MLRSWALALLQAAACAGYLLSRTNEILHLPLLPVAPAAALTAPASASPLRANLPQGRALASTASAAILRQPTASTAANYDARNLSPADAHGHGSASRRLDAPAPLPQAELDALWDMYTHLNGKAWRWKDSAVYGGIWAIPDSAASPKTPPTAEEWAAMKPTPDPCSWQGIECTCAPRTHPFPTQDFYYSDTDDATHPAKTECHVAKIQLIGYGFAGPFPAAALAAFSELAVVQMIPTADDKAGAIGLTGDLSDAATAAALKGKLTKLKKLHLSQNSLSGTVADWICACKALKSLWLDGNSLVGVPPYIGQLTALQSLRLGSNSIATFPLAAISGQPDQKDGRGAVPGLKALKEIDLSHNLIGGDRAPLLTQLFQLAAIQRVYLGYNYPPKQPDKTVVPSPTSLPKKMLPESLTELSLPGMGLSGTFPVEVLGNHDLVLLDLSGNSDLAGVIPHSVCFDYNKGAAKVRRYIKYIDRCIDKY